MIPMISAYARENARTIAADHTPSRRRLTAFRHPFSPSPPSLRPCYPPPPRYFIPRSRQRLISFAHANSPCRKICGTAATVAAAADPFAVRELA